jgi:hypothetical protein
MYVGKDKAQELGNRAINNPSLLDRLDEDTFIKFVVCISKHDKSLASKVFNLKYDKISAQGKVLFWEAVGILTKTEEYV